MKKFNLTSEKTMITEERLKAVLLPSFLSIILSVILLSFVRNDMGMV